MRQNFLRYIVALIVVGGHLGLLAIIVLYLDDIIKEPEEKTRVLLSLGPVAGTYLVAVVKTAIRERHNFRPQPFVSLEFSLLTIGLFSFFMAALFYVTLKYPTSLAHNVGSLAEFIQALEIALGGTLGLLVDVVFPSAPNEVAPSGHTSITPH